MDRCCAFASCSTADFKGTHPSGTKSSFIRAPREHPRGARKPAVRAGLSDASYPRVMTSLRPGRLASKPECIARGSEQVVMEVTFSSRQCDHIVGWRKFRQQPGARDVVNGMLGDVPRI